MTRLLILALALIPALVSAQTVLRQATAVNLAVGPFVDSTDGVTAETALTISQADVRLKKNDAAWAQKTESTACTHEENGWYECPLDTTDTGTVGILQIAVNESGALPVFKTYQIVEEATYDLAYAASATGQVTVAAMSSGALADLFDTDSGTTYASAVSGSVVKEIADNSAGGSLTQADFGIHETTIATLASQTSFTLTTGSADDGAYNGYGLLGVDQSTSTQTALGVVSDYTGSTKTITLDADPAVFTMAPGDTVILLPAKLTDAVNIDASAIRAAVGLANPDLDTQLDTIDGFLDTEVAAILSDTTDILADTAVIGVASDLGSGATIAGNLTDIEGQTDDIGVAGAGLTEAGGTGDQLTAVPYNSAWDAEIQSEATDALNAYDPPTDAEMDAAIAALNDIAATDLRDLTIEDQGSGVTLGCAISVLLAYAAGDLTTSSGTSTYEDPSGTETRVTGTVSSAGNRTAAITCPTY